MNKIIIPVKIEGRLSGYNALTATVEREASLTVDFDLTDVNAYVPKFINAQSGKDKIAPAHNLLLQIVTDNDKVDLSNRIKGDPAAVMTIFGELADIILPDAEKVQKKSSPSLTDTNPAD
jgi:hypothetical protein